MKLAIFDDFRLGLVSPDETAIADLTSAVPWSHDPDPLGAGWWVRLCRDFADLRSTLEAPAMSLRPSQPLDAVRLRPPVLNPSKIVACAVNYAEHQAEMRETVQQRVGGSTEHHRLCLERHAARARRRDPDRCSRRRR